MPELAYTETLVTTHCWCGIAHAIPTNLMRWANESKSNVVYCPLGHEWVSGTDYKDKLAKEKEAREKAEQRTRATRDLLTAEERKNARLRTQARNAKRRAANGVCPCCGRTFQQLARHMKTKHPDYVEEAKP